MIIRAIFCVGPDNVIGTNEHKMPWYSSADFRFFKKCTVGAPCVFGRTTYYNLPTRPLRNRLNCVLSSGFAHSGVIVGEHLEYNSIYDLIHCPVLNGFDTLWVCGGARVYDAFMKDDLIDEVYVTDIRSPDLTRRIMATPNNFIKLTPHTTEIFTNNDKWSRRQIGTAREQDYKLAFHIFTNRRTR